MCTQLSIGHIVCNAIAEKNRARHMLRIGGGTYFFTFSPKIVIFNKRSVIGVCAEHKSENTYFAI